MAIMEGGGAPAAPGVGPGASAPAHITAKHDTPADPFRWYDAIATLMFIIAIVGIVAMLVNCGAYPMTLCMEHPQRGRLCVTMFEGRVSNVTIDSRLSDDDEKALIEWAQAQLAVPSHER